METIISTMSSGKDVLLTRVSVTTFLVSNTSSILRQAAARLANDQNPTQKEIADNNSRSSEPKSKKEKKLSPHRT